MKIQKILSQHRNDYAAIMECEHCGATQKDMRGYDDAYYHDHVIPAMHCMSCGKTRDGTAKAA